MAGVDLVRPGMPGLCRVYLYPTRDASIMSYVVRTAMSMSLRGGFEVDTYHM